MALRFHKSIGLGKGLRLNIGKSGIGVTSGVKGAHLSINSNGRKTTSIGIPGTGISYIKSKKLGKNKSYDKTPSITQKSSNNLKTADRKRGCATGGIVLLIVIVISSAISQCSGSSSPSSSSFPISELPSSTTSVIDTSSELFPSELSSSELSSSELSSSELSSSELSSSSVSYSISSNISKSKSSKSKTAKSTPHKIVKKDKIKDSTIYVGNSCNVIITYPGTVKNGHKATLTIQGTPNTKYSIVVYYSSGPSKSKDLEPKISDSKGIVSWRWKVGRKTRPGVHDIEVKGGGDVIKTKITTIR